MGTSAYELQFDGSIEVSTTYDHTKISILGNHIAQQSLSPTPEDNFIGPLPVSVIRCVELSGWVPAAMHVINYYGKYYIFSGDSATAASTRRVACFVYDPASNSSSYLGFVTLTFPTITAHTIRGLRVSVQKYTTGTVDVSGTSVTGESTLWQTSNLCVGSRIGFGSTNPNEITTWYQIANINSDTSITLTGNALDASDVPYVIEDFRIYTTTTNATTTAGGLFVTKGLRIDGFGAAGVIIPSATTVDNIRAVYSLKDSSTLTNTAASGLTYHEFVDWDTEWIYVPNGQSTTLSIYKYNVRTTLDSLSSGAQTLSFPDVVITGTQSVTGTIRPFNNGRITTTNHGPGDGEDSLYLTTSSRVLRIKLNDVITGSNAFVSDQMIEVPYGGTSSIPATAALEVAEYSPYLDKFLIPAFVANNGRIYVTDYKSDGGQFDDHFGTISQSYDQSLANNPLFPKIFAIQPQLWAEDGFLFWASGFGGTTASTGYIYILPGFGADWAFVEETNDRAILPAITLGATPTKLKKVYVSAVQYLSTLPKMIKTTEPYRVVYRTSGIEDNSGAWSILPQSGVLTGVAPTTQIQFAIEFHTFGDFCIYPRVNSLCLVYEDDKAIPDEFQWNFGDSNIIDATFGFIQRSLVSPWPGGFRIKMYRSDINSLVLEQTSDDDLLGVFQYWDGTSWEDGVGPNTIGTRRRFVPSNSLPGGVDIYATLQVE